MKYFSIENVNEKWQFTTPEGEGFFSLGVDCVTVNDVEFKKSDLVFKNNAGWFPKWADEKLATINSLGFNSLGSWHHPYFWGNGYPKSVELNLSKHSKKVNTTWGVGFPDVFDDSFVASIHKVLIDCFYGKGNELLTDDGMMGYYTDNEIHWWGSSGTWGEDNQGQTAQSTALIDDYIGLPAESAGKKAFVNFIKERYQAIENLNESWGSEYSEFDDLLYIQVYRAEHSALEKDKSDFLEVVATIYFEQTSKLLKQYDPNHLNLGCRLVGNSTPEVVLKVMGQYVDAISANFYSMELPREYLDYVYSVTKKPIMITEFSVCAGRSAGYLYNTNGARSVLVKDQKRRGEVYNKFINDAYECPYIIAAHWFALFDFGMNIHGLVGNYGLFDVEDKLWEEFAESVKQTHSLLKRGNYNT